MPYVSVTTDSIQYDFDSNEVSVFVRKTDDSHHYPPAADDTEQALVYKFQFLPSQEKNIYRLLSIDFQSSPIGSIEKWQSFLPQPAAEYTITPAHSSAPVEGSILPQDGNLTLKASWRGSYGTLADAANLYGLTLEELQALNPGITDDSLWSEDGTPYYKDLILQNNYSFQPAEVKTVTIAATWGEDDSEKARSYEVPAYLGDQAAAALAEAFEFLRSYSFGGYRPLEPVEGKENLYRSMQGARFTRYSDFNQYLDAVFAADFSGQYTAGIAYDDTFAMYLGGFGPGENDELLFAPNGERGIAPNYCGSAYSRPQLKADGSLFFWQLAMYAGADYTGWGGEEPVTVRDIFLTPVRLVPTQTGWRVAELSLAY